jgi:hypothetical protein
MTFGGEPRPAFAIEEQLIVERLEGDDGSFMGPQAVPDRVDDPRPTIRCWRSSGGPRRLDPPYAVCPIR